MPAITGHLSTVWYFWVSTFFRLLTNGHTQMVQVNGGVIKGSISLVGKEDYGHSVDTMLLCGVGY